MALDPRPGPEGPRQLPFSSLADPSAEPSPPQSIRAGGAELPVEVVRSTRRRKTVQARMDGGTLRLMVPARMSAAEVAHWTHEMRRRFRRQHQSGRVDVEARARALARRHDLPQPTSVRWVTNQQQRWGSCTPVTGEIRVTDRLAAWPPWVLDYVLVHELAHLVHADHSPAFHHLVDRYAKAERARGFLIAKGLDPDDETPDDETSSDRPPDDGTKGHAAS